MVDYYSELNIDSGLSLDEINKELSKLENTWKRRELTSPEKATKMLALIIDAREAFKSTAAKSRYDRELAESKNQSKSVDPNQQRKDDIHKWRTDADTYYDRGEYDLAKIAVDRALALVTDSSDDDLYSLAASVYMEVGEYNVALSFINNAIVSNPQNGLHYLVKAGIYGRSASALRFNDRFKSSQYYEEERKALQIGLNVANSTGDTYAKSRLLGAYAFSLYFDPNPDQARAEELAKEALALGENLGNAQKVIDAVNEQIYSKAKKEEEYDNLAHLQKALEMYRSLGDWRDASERSSACCKRIGQLEDEENRRQQEEQRLYEEQVRKAKAEAEERERREKAEAEERERRAQAEAEAQKKKKEQSIKLIKIAVPIFAALIAAVVLINKVFIPSRNYHNAMNLMNAGSYDEAIAVFVSLDGFRNSEEKINECYDAISQEKYDVAVELMNEGKYEEAIAVFDALGNYGESALQASSCKDAIMQLQYEAAVSLMRNGEYEEAISAFESLGYYSDSSEQVNVCKELHAQQQYQMAITLMNDGKLEESLAIFSSLSNYEKSERYIFDIKMLLAAPLHDTISSGSEHSVALKNDGTVIATKSPTRDIWNRGQCDVYTWTNIIAVSAGGYHTVGLKTDGTVVAVGRNDEGQCNVSGWTDIVAISAGSYSTLGLKADGTVVAVGENSNGQCNVSDWTNIVAIAAGWENTFALKSDGTVLAIGSSYGNVLDAANWTNITKIKASVSSVVGLKSDGTVLVLGDSLKQENVNGWADIVDVVVGRRNVMALKSDGTVLRDGSDINGASALGKAYDWTNIVLLSMHDEHCIGLKVDGTVVGAGYNSSGCLEVDGWSNIRIPSE